MSENNVSPLQVMLEQPDYVFSCIDEFCRAILFFSETNREVIHSSLVAYVEAGNFDCPEDVVAAIFWLLFFKSKYGSCGFYPEFDPLLNGRALALLSSPFRYSNADSVTEVCSDV